MDTRNAFSIGGEEYRNKRCIGILFVYWIDDALAFGSFGMVLCSCASPIGANPMQVGTWHSGSPVPFFFFFGELSPVQVDCKIPPYPRPIGHVKTNTMLEMEKGDAWLNVIILLIG